MNQRIEDKNKELVLKAFDTLINKRDYAAAEHYWSHAPTGSAKGSSAMTITSNLPAVCCAVPMELLMVQGFMVHLLKSRACDFTSFSFSCW